MEQTVLESTIRKIVQEGDVDKLTLKIIIQKAQDILQTDLSEKKSRIKEILNSIISEIGSAEAESSNKEKSPSTDNQPKEAKTEPKPEKTHKNVSSIEAETGLTRGEIEAQRLLYEAFKSGSRGTRQTRSSSNPPKRKPTKKSKKRQRVVDSDDEGNDASKNEDAKQEKAPKKKRASGLTKPAVLSSELAEFLGAERLPRTEVVKRLTAYVKEHNLQNPNNRKQIFCDEKLKAVFKVAKTDFFKINKLISKHVKPADEVVGEPEDNSNTNNIKDEDHQEMEDNEGNESNEENNNVPMVPKLEEATESTEDKQ